jgi:hypothetical protein
MFKEGQKAYLYSEIWQYSSKISLIKMIPLFIQLTFTKYLPLYFKKVCQNWKKSDPKSTNKKQRGV